MNYNYLKNSHNKIFKTSKFIFKFFKSKNKYIIERDFYIKTRNKYEFIPKLYYFSDKRFMIIIENVGIRIKKRDIDFKALRIINDILIKDNIFQNDYRCKNILYNKDKNMWYIIDWEHYGDKFNDFRKSPVYDDIRNELFI